MNTDRPRTRNRVVAVGIALFAAASFGGLAVAQVSVGVGIGLPSLRIGINFPVYPQFVQVPGYPVYYAPQVDANYFFYDGMYWVYANDNWYASSWYNGPWALVAPVVVPVFILRVPVRYYRAPPVYFHGWRQDAPPQWGEHWGADWQRQRTGWDNWNHKSVPAAAPLPTYQQKYSGKQYPTYEKQRTIISQEYRYQPHEPVVQEHYKQYVTAKAAAPSPQERPRQQGPAAEGEKAATEPKPDQGRDENGDKRPDKDEPRGN